MASRRLVETLLVLAVALALLAPMILGPALSPLARAFGGDGGHACACGMAPGTCGCPECARIEHQRLRERAPAPYAVLRSQCDGGDVAPGGSALPPSLPAAARLGIVPAPAVAAVAALLVRASSLDAFPPATPPPRPRISRTA